MIVGYLITCEMYHWLSCNLLLSTVVCSSLGTLHVKYKKEQNHYMHIRTTTTPQAHCKLRVVGSMYSLLGYNFCLALPN